MDLIQMNNIIRVAQFEAPVDVEKIAKKLGVSVFYSSMKKEISGYIENRGDKNYKIVLNLDHSHVRHRFTIAHELGHWWHHRNEIDENERIVEHLEDGRLYRDRLFRKGCSLEEGRVLDDSYESEANRFAADLLMPEQLIFKLIFEQKVKEVKVLAGQLEVPRRVLEYRLETLGFDAEDIATGFV